MSTAVITSCIRAVTALIISVANHRIEDLEKKVEA